MSPTPPLPVTEDTPPDMLAGSMDLPVVLPNGRSVKMSVERSTPMMDLLVQVTTANKIPPGGHVIQAMGDRGVLPYKPSTPIGALDTWSIQVVTKSSLGGRKAPLRPSNQQPFEQTFRLQVHLPRNQLFVTRVSSKIALSDILSQVCLEKNLDPEKYELRHPGNLDQVLDARSSLADYKLQEVVLVARSTRPLGLASTDIIVLHREEEKRRQQAKSGSTSSSSTSRFFGAVFKRSNRSSAEGSISSDSLGGRSSSPTRSNESASRSASPPVPGLPPMMAQPPPRPQRKRRPAPKPPASNNNFINNDNNNSNNKTGDQQLEEVQPSSGSNKPGQGSEKDGGVIISHSRNSSDSSGYHEASVLSESPDSHAGPQGYQGPSDTLPRRSKLTSVRQDPVVVEHPHALSRSLSSLAVDGHEGGVTSNVAPARKTVLSASTTALASAGQAPRKKRVAPPPPPLFKNNETKPDMKPSDNLSEPVAPPRQAVGHRDDRLKTSSLDRNVREKAEGSAALDKSATLPAKTSLSKQGSSASSLENVSKTSLQSFSSMEEEIVEVAEEEEEEEDTIPLQKTPIAPPVKDPVVEVEDTPNPPLASVLPSRRDADTNLPVDKLELEGDSQEEEDAADDDELPHEPDSRPAASHQSISSKQEPSRSSSSSSPQKPPVSPAALPPPDLVPLAATSSTEGPLDVIDWEYQLPAPPTAFRDTNSPTLVEGETVVLADTGVFREEVTESSLDSGDFSLQDGDSFRPTRIHSRNLEPTRKEFAVSGLEFDIQREGDFTKISRVNPLFDARQFEIDSQIIDQPKSQSKVSDVGTLTKDKPKTADTIPREIIRDEPHVQKDSSRSSSNVSMHRPTVVQESNQSGQLSNFKITTYQIPREPDKLFEGEKEIFKKPLPVSNRSHRYGSVGSVGPFWSGDLEGKKSMSYAALEYDSRPTRTKSVGNLAAEVAIESERRDARLLKTASHQNVNEDLETPLPLQQGHGQKDLSLQSLQVLRNILPRLTPQTPSEDSKREDKDIQAVADVIPREEEKVPRRETEFPVSQESFSSIHEQTAPTPAPEKESSAEKVYTYQGPPSINLSSWSERPKVKVDIKADSDYRIGRGKDTHAETPKTESAREVPRAEAKLDVRRSRVDSVDGSQILKEVAPPESSSPPPPPPTTKIESTPLTMRLVSHNSVSSSKKSLSTSQILESIARENPLVVGAAAKEPTLVHVIPSSLSPAQRADPSRVPIVRAVELKKPYKQQLQDNDSNLNVSINIVRKNEELLVNNSNSNNGHISRTVSSVNQSKEENPRTDSDTFKGVNSLAKKFSSGVPLRSNALGPKPFQPRAVSTYEFSNKDTNKVYLNDNPQKTQGGHNILVKSSSTSNVSGPNVTVTSYDGSRRFTSVVGINKTLGPPPHEVVKTTEGVNPQNIHQRPSGSSIVKVNGFTGARQPFMPVVKGFQFTPQGSDASTVSVKVGQQPLSTEVNAPKTNAS